MEESQSHADSIVDDTLILVGLLLAQSLLFKSGYPADVMQELEDRLALLIKQYTKKGF